MTPEPEHHAELDAVEMPVPTFWPVMLAAGVTLLLFGLVTSLAFSLAGFVLVGAAGVGWFRHVYLPAVGEFHEKFVPPEQRPQQPQPTLGGVQELRPGMAGARMLVPEKFHPYSAGAKGGLIGAVTMTVPALLYGIVSDHGIWYPVNLLAGMLLPQIETETVAQLEKFSLLALVLGTVIHGITSVSLGLIYGVLLPMLPGRPIFWGGVVAPLLWTGAIYGFMGVINPALHDKVYWPAFIASQFIYGLTVGIVVIRTEKVYVEQ